MLKNTASGVPAPWPPFGRTVIATLCEIWQAITFFASCALTYSFVRSTRPGFLFEMHQANHGLPFEGLRSGRAFLNTPYFIILIILGGPHADQNAKHFDYSTAPFETQLNAVAFCFFSQMGFQSTRNSQNSSYGHCRNPFLSTNVPVEKGCC